MLEGIEFNGAFDKYIPGEFEYILDDEEAIDSIESKGSSEEGFNIEFELSEEVKTSQEKEEFSNHDLRLLNDYFKELGTEPLLTPKEEVKTAAKIRKCKIRLKEIKKVIEKTIGKKLERDDIIKSTIETLNEISDHNSSKIEIKSKRLRRLITLFETYSKKSMQFRNTFIKANLRLVASIAKRYLGRGLPYLDLIQEGNLGLIRAVERFDYKKGYRFATYASWWIHQGIIRAISSQTKTIRIPSYLLEKYGRVQWVSSKLQREMGRKPLPQEIARRANIPLGRVKQVLVANENIIHLDSPVRHGEKMTFMELIADPNSLLPDSLMATASIPESVSNVLSVLNTREREVIKMRFGIGYENPSTLDEVRKRFGVTRERIRQIEKRAIEKIKRSKSAPALKSLIEEHP